MRSDPPPSRFIAARRLIPLRSDKCGGPWRCRVSSRHNFYVVLFLAWNLGPHQRERLAGRWRCPFPFSKRNDANN